MRVSGSAVVAGLLGAGHQVVGLARSDSSAAAVQAVALDNPVSSERTRQQLAWQPASTPCERSPPAGRAPSTF